MSDESDKQPAILVLTKTQLAIEDGELIRRNDAGGIILRFPLDDIESVQFVKAFNPFVFTFLVLVVGFVAIGYYISEYNIVTVLLYVAALILAVLGVFGMFEDTIILNVRGSERVRISSPDPTDDVRGFVASAKSMIGGL